MTKSLYWLSGPGETYVQVEGATRRDELAGHGWEPADTPPELGRVWLRHNTTGAFAKFTAAGVDSALALGWEFAVPPTRPADLGHEVVLPSPVPANAHTGPSPDIEENPAQPAQTEAPPPAVKKTDSKKENDRV